MKDNLKIVFLGTPQNAAIVLEKLAASPFKPSLVITGQDQKASRGLPLKATAVKLVAEIHKIAVDYKLSAIDNTFDLAILVAFGQMIPEKILKRPKYGFLNIHPSLLPKYRGPSPIYQAILTGDEKTGITIIKLDNELDHGPILAQKELAVENTDTHQSTMERTAILGADVLIEILPNYLDGSLKPQAQDHKVATYTEKVSKQNGYIDTNNPPDPKTLDRMIRAYFPWPTVWTEIDGKRIKFLPEGKIQPEGKRPMTQKEFQNGYPNIAKKLTFLFD